VLADASAMLLGLLLLALLVGATTALTASEYDPAGLYDVDYLKLSNGFDVILKRRTQAHSVSVRLVVNVGSRNFPCAKRETPHFFEHLLFMGTSKHSEAELARLIQDHGGAWNGYTLPTETGYQIDIFAKYLPLAIDTLYEMMTDTVITPKTIESARAVIHRERSDNFSWLVRWVYKNGLFKSASIKAGELLLSGTGVLCPGFITPDGVQEKDVKDTYHNYYVPSNMTLVVVGNFDKRSLVSQIKVTFAQMAPRAPKRTKVVTPPYMTGSTQVTGTLSPLVGSDGSIGFLYRTDGYEANLRDYYALWVAWKYLERVLYEKIRIERALSYSPASYFTADRDYGLFAIAADVNLDKMQTAKPLLEQELENLRRGRLNTHDVEMAKRRILLARVQAYETNSAIAAYYVTKRYELQKTGKLTNHEAAIAKVTVADIKRVANKYLRSDRQVVMWAEPTFTYTQFVILLAVLIVGVPGLAFYLVRRFLKNRQATGAL
jgi:predicted Zn-dependent peptidase